MDNDGRHVDNDGRHVDNDGLRCRPPAPVRMSTDFGPERRPVWNKCPYPLLITHRPATVDPKRVRGTGFGPLLGGVHPVLPSPPGREQKLEHIVHCDLAQHAVVVVDHGGHGQVVVRHFAHNLVDICVRGH